MVTVKAYINLTENTQRKAIRFIPKISKLDYQERLEQLNLPTLACRRLHGLLKPTKYCTTYDANFTNSLFELKKSDTRGHKLSRTSIRQNFFS